MPVTRNYRCDDCQCEFEKFHMSRDEPAPDCPVCTGAVEQMPSRVNIGTNRGKAIDLAQTIAENEYGMTNLQDNLREGDIAAPKVSAMQTSEADAIRQQMQELHTQAHQGPAPDAPPSMNLSTFWQQASGAPMVDPSAGAAGAKEARSLGVDAVSLVEKAKAGGHDRMKFQVLAKGNG